MLTLILRHLELKRAGIVTKHEHVEELCFELKRKRTNFKTIKDGVEHN